MEIDYEKLAKTGIKISDRDYDKKDPQKMLCPACKNGRKKHKKNKPLAVYWKDCYAKCFNCGESFFFGKTQKLNDGQQPNTQPMKKNSKEYKKPNFLFRAVMIFIVAALIIINLVLFLQNYLQIQL